MAPIRASSPRSRRACRPGPAQRWLVNVSNKAPEGLTVREQRVEREQAARDAAHEDPLVKAILETFPGAKVVNVKVRDDAVIAAPETIAPLEPEEDDE